MTTTSTILLIVHAPSVPISSERRFPGNAPLDEIKTRFEFLTGIPVNSQGLSLWSARTDDKDSRARLILTISEANEHQTLEDIGAQDGMGVTIDDRRGSSERNQFNQDEEDKVEKFEINDEEYAQRADTVMAYKQRMKLGRFAESVETEKKQSISPTTSISTSQINSRCETEDGRRGTIRFVGSTHFASGTWIGVEFDELVGKNDGSVGEKRYFQCAAKYGAFIKPDKVQIGDFPVRSIEDEFDDMEEM